MLLTKINFKGEIKMKKEKILAALMAAAMIAANGTVLQRSLSRKKQL